MIPNCVPEYYRSLQDDYDHECELEMNRMEWYRKNKEYREQKYIDGCNEIRFYPDECCKCQYGEEAYKGRLIMRGYDPDLIKMHKRNLTTEEFNMTDLED